MEYEFKSKNLKLIDFPFTLGTVVSAMMDAARFGHIGSRFHFYVVGGMVRDTYLGVANSKSDMDIAFSGDLMLLLGCLDTSEDFKIIRVNKNLNTARVSYYDEASRSQIEFDLAQLRAEDYSAGRPYPEVSFNNIPIQWDLARRDFTVNALAFDVVAEMIIDPFNGYDDIVDQKIRVLHEESFKDDPTRLVRAITQAKRFGFDIDDDTKYLARQALVARAFDKLTPAQFSDEMRATLKENRDCFN
ncbi:MAG: CCA tRNA nucleotidyltransferase [Coriobacteriia bacterium]|nr:CCA tRNA nucleotidyltransferase [Coriobacteriia bacterium]